MPAYLVPNTCVSHPWGGFRKKHRRIPLQERAGGAARVTDTSLWASGERSEQPAGQAVSSSSAPAASLSVPSPSAAQPWVPASAQGAHLACRDSKGVQCTGRTDSKLGLPTWACNGGRGGFGGWNTKTKLGLQQSVLTSAYCDGASWSGFFLYLYFWARKTKSTGIRKSVSKRFPINSTATQHRHLSWTLKFTPAPSKHFPNLHHRHSSLFEKMWVFG